MQRTYWLSTLRLVRIRKSYLQSNNMYNGVCGLAHTYTQIHTPHYKLILFFLIINSQFVCAQYTIKKNMNLECSMS